MTERTQRRAAERKARKAEQKRLRSQPPAIAAAAEAPVSEAQLAANRANAQLSSGPVTELGKSISSRNNFRHGLTQFEGEPVLLASESKQQYAQLLAAYEKEWQPNTPTEQDLVSRLVTHSWLRRRALNLQNNFVNLDTGLIADEKKFNLYRRYEVQHERAYNKALSDLMRLRAIHLREQNGFESQRRQNERHEYQIRRLQHREKLHQLAEKTAEARLSLAQNKLAGIATPAQPSGDFVSTSDHHGISAPAAV